MKLLTVVWVPPNVHLMRSEPPAILQLVVVKLIRLNPIVPRARRLLAALSALLYLSTQLGLPLPLVAVSSKHSGPRICQGHRCGCSSAMRAMGQCCCSHGLRQSIPDRPQRATTKSKCCRRHADPGKLASAAVSESSPSRPARSKRQRRTFVFSMIEAQPCQGATPWRVVAPVSSPPPDPVDVPRIDTVVGFSCPVRLQTPLCLLEPPVPPPRG